MNKWLPIPEELSVPLHKASVRKGVRLEALSCPPNHRCPQLLEKKADPGSLVLLVPARKEREEGLRGGGKARARDGAGQRVGPQYLTKNARCYQANMETEMMTARMRTVMDTQMAINTFFCGRGMGQGNSLRMGREGHPGQGRGVRAHLPSLLLILQGHLDMFLPTFHIVC